MRLLLTWVVVFLLGFTLSSLGVSGWVIIPSCFAVGILLGWLFRWNP
jgi:hypothetical protein